MGIETLAIASLGASLIGGGVSAVGNVMAGQSAQAAANYRAQVAENQARHALAIGDIEAQRQGMKTASIIGAQRAAQSGSGLDVNVGSPVDVRETTDILGRLDELTILNNAQTKAWGLRSQAELDRYSGKASAQEGWLKGAGSVLSTVSSVSSKWLPYQRYGMFEV